MVNDTERSGGSVSRRRVLRVAGTAGILGSAGAVAGGDPGEGEGNGNGGRGGNRSDGGDRGQGNGDGDSDTEPYIVGTTNTRGRDEASERAEEVRNVLHFGDTGWAVAGEFDEQARQNLEQRNDVRYVEEDRELEAFDHTADGDPTQLQVLPWGIDRVEADEAHHDDETGGGSSVAVIDTGIDPEHESLDVAGGEAFTSCLGLTCSEDWDDDNDHGTHCAGTAAAVDNDVGVVGAAPAVDLYAVKVLNAVGTGFTSDIAAGIEWTADEGIDVGSLSLGGGGTETLQDACEYAHDQGTLLVAAAGNDGPCEDCVSYPAAYDTVVAVSATDQDDDLASFSSQGPEIELAAPGVDVLSTVTNNGYDEYDGTSMACPHVAGAGAQLMEHGDSNESARDQLRETAEDVDLDENEQGDGLVDVAAALGVETDD